MIRIEHNKVYPTRWADLTKEECRKIDREQPERRRLYADQTDNITVMAAMVSWLSDIIEMPHMKSLLQKEKLYGPMKGGVAILRGCKNRIHDHTSALQLRTVDANWKTASFLMSSTPIEGYVNIRGEVLEELAKSACAACRAEMCMKSRAEAASCPRKEMLDQVPGVGHIIRRAPLDIVDACPYSLADDPDREI